MEKERQYLVWNADKRVRESQYLIVTCLFDIRELSTAIVRSLYNYLAGSNCKTVQKHLDVLDKMLIKRYWGAYMRDAEKVLYKDWLQIESKHLLPVRDITEFYKKMPYREYQKAYREKKKREKLARFAQE